MTQIKIEVPSNDPIALSALGEALQRIAAERGYERSPRVEGQVESFTKTVQSGDQSVTETTTRTVDTPTREELVEQMESFETPKNDDYVEELPESATTLANQVNQLHDQVDPYGEKVKFEDIETSGPTIEEMTEDGTLSPLPTDDTLDADGLPWDKRIHSRGKTRLADDTWRLARKPNDKTQEEWDEYVASVKAELKAVQDIPAPGLTEEQVREEIKEKLESGEVVVQAPTETLTPPVVETEVVTPPVVETETVTPPTLDEQAVADVQASEPVPAVEPPASVTAPVVDNTAMPTTFQELMKYITSDAAKRGATNDMIKEVLAQVDSSLTAIPLIANRVDLIPAFVAKLEGRLS